MKKRAILYLAIAMLLIELPKTIFGQDTIIVGSFPSAESLKTFTEDMEIMQEALKKQLKDFHINHDSFMKQMEIFKDQMKDFHIDPIVIPDDFSQSFGNTFDKDMFATTVNLQGESKPKEVIVKVEKEIPVMFLTINGGIKSGSVSVEIYDPNGKKQGSFTIENDADENSEVTNGSINRSFKAPMKGKWKVRVDSNKAYGNVFITSIQKQ